MRLLLVNPNMTVAMTDAMTRQAQSVAGDQAEIVSITAPRGFPYIASRAEALIAGGIALEMIAENAEGMDAVILGAFGDPGLTGARELFDLPVVGMADAAVMSAAMLGQTFGIVTFSPLMTRWYEDCVIATGLRQRFTGVRTPDMPPEDVSSVAESLNRELIRLCELAVRRDGADVVILGGAPLAGLGPRIADEVPALVIDPISAATVQALALARLGVRCGKRHWAPAPKNSLGLAPSLAHRIMGKRHGA